MLILLLTGLALAGLSAALLARGVSVGRTRVSDTLAQIDAYGYERLPEEESDTAGPIATLVHRLAAMLGNAVGARLGAAREASLREQLLAAGSYRTTARMFVGYRVLLAAGVVAFLLWWSPGVGIVGLLMVVIAGFAAWRLPLFVLARRARARLQRIERGLPELIDILVVTIESGLGFSGSLQMASERISGPLGDELKLTLQEQRMGLGMNEALRNLLARADTPNVRSFVRSVLQGETLGVSIGQIMRELAVDMRKRRRASAEEQAQKAPIKIMFPLVVLLFPAIFVIVLFPAVLSFLRAF